METTQSDFDFISRFIRDRAAIQLGADKMYLLDARLGPVCRQYKFRNIPELVQALRRGTDPQLATDVTDSLTTNETLWFRDGHPWDTLRSRILPDIRQHAQASKSVTIWCGASSTGQEPYSLAITIADHFPEFLQWNFKFIATDLSTRVLKRAEEGIYSTMELNRGMPDNLRRRYFEQQGANRWQISKRLRDLVSFQQLNLMDQYNHVTNCDLIMMRNVLIYFSAMDKKMILTKALKRLKPHGYFMLGSSESTLDVHTALVPERLDRTVAYRPPTAVKKSA